MSLCDVSHSLIASAAQMTCAEIEECRLVEEATSYCTTVLLRESVHQFAHQG